MRLPVSTALYPTQEIVVSYLPGQHRRTNFFRTTQNFKVFEARQTDGWHRWKKSTLTKRAKRRYKGCSQ
jgi:hypothetical protein